MIIRLVCYRRGLAIGAVSSPIISNVLCFEMDEILLDIARQSGVKYTRYADDLYFSASEPNVLPDIERQIAKVLKILPYPSELQVNHRKTIRTSRKHRMNVTGLTLTNSGKVSIGRSKKREIRSKIHNWSTMSHGERSSLQGYLAFCQGVEPEFITRLKLKFGSEKVNEILRWNTKV